LKILRFSIIYGSTPTTVVLTHSPDGWNNSFVEITRSEEYHGLMNSYIQNLKFVKDGATLLRTIFYNALPNYTNVYLKVEKLNKITLVYSQIFYGEIKMDTFVDEQNYVEVIMTEGELVHILKKNISTNYEIKVIEDFYGNIENATFKIDNFTIRAITLDRFLTFVFNNVCSNGVDFGYTYSGMTNPADSNGSYIPSGRYNNENYYVYNGYCLFRAVNMGGHTNYWFIIAGIVPNEAADEYFYAPKLNLGWDEYGGWTLDVGGMDVVKNPNPYGLNYDALNPYLDTVLITSGFFISYTGQQPGEICVCASLEDFYKSIVGFTGLSMCVEIIGGVETLILRPFADCYDNTNEIENIGEVASDYKISLWGKAISEVVIGYPEKSYKDATDNLELAGENTYIIGNQNYKNELNLMSKYRGDGNGITDILLGAANDEDLFLVCVQTHQGAAYLEIEPNQVRRILDNTITGTLYNTRISPQRNLIVNKDYICSLTYGNSLDSYRLTQKIRDKDSNSLKNNLDCESTLDGGTTWLQEREGLLISSGTKFLLPFIFKFTGMVSEDFTTNFNTHPTGYISFTIKGNSYKGFISKAKYKPTGKTKCEFELISTPDNDLTLLIR